jgi:hypothetical protein
LLIGSRAQGHAGLPEERRLFVGAAAEATKDTLLRLGRPEDPQALACPTFGGGGDPDKRKTPNIEAFISISGVFSVPGTGFEPVLPP